MPIFLSWSGNCSQKYADVLGPWLRLVAPGETVFYSPNLRAGTIGLIGMLDALRNSTFAVLCLTPSNLDNGWLHFEAGAILNNLGAVVEGTERPPVVPVLCHGAKMEDLKEPLRLVQAKECDENGLRELADSLNKSRGPQAIPDDVLMDLFRLLWNELRPKIESITCESEPIQLTERPTNPIEARLDRLQREVETLVQRRDITGGRSVSTPAGLAAIRMAASFRREIKTRAAQAGHIAIEASTIGTPDLIIDGNVFVEVKVLSDTAHSARRVREALYTAKRWRDQSAPESVILGFVGQSLSARDFELLKSERCPVIWSLTGTQIFGNVHALRDFRYLIDGTFAPSDEDEEG